MEVVWIRFGLIFWFFPAIEDSFSSIFMLVECCCLCNGSSFRLHTLTVLVIGRLTQRHTGQVTGDKTI